MGKYFYFRLSEIQWASVSLHFVYEKNLADDWCRHINKRRENLAGNQYSWAIFFHLPDASTFLRIYGEIMISSSRKIAFTFNAKIKNGHINLLRA